MINDSAVNNVDAVGRAAAVVIAELEENDQRYVIDYTCPPRITFALEEDILYVLRQHIDASGTHHLTVAAKMGKEV